MSRDGRRAGHRLSALVRPMVVGLCLIAAAPLMAQSDDPEVIFWDSVAHSNSPSEIRAYLEAYPSGRFAALARLRLKQTSAPSLPAQQGATKADGAWVRPNSPSVRLVSGVVLDMDASRLRGSSNLRIAVMPAGAPDAIADKQAFIEGSSSVPASRLHLTIPAGPPGHDEVRLYHIPPFATDYSLAARASVTVVSGVPGATLPRDLTLEAERAGPLRFEASHRDRPVLVQAAFLRARPRTEWNMQWFNGALQEVPGRQTAVISIGLPNVVPDLNGSVGEIVCVAVADDQAQLNRLASFQAGDPILVRGIPTSWGSATASDPVVLRDCTLAE